MEEKIKKNNIILIFIKNLILEFLITLVLIFILSIVLSKSSLSEKAINPCIIFITAFSILIGGFFSSKKIGNKGILVGFLQGFIYIFILYLCSSISNGDFSLGVSSLIMIFMTLICGRNWGNIRSKFFINI